MNKGLAATHATLRALAGGGIGALLALPVALLAAFLDHRRDFALRTLQYLGRDGAHWVLAGAGLGILGSALVAWIRHRRHRSAMRAWPRWLALPGALGWVGLGLLGWSHLSAPQRPHVFLIVIDTLRADHLEMYGHPRQTSAELKKLTEQSVLYRNVISTAPWTSPAVAAILSGRYPAELGIKRSEVVLGENVVLLPELLRDAGYATVGVISHILIGRLLNYDQGFDDWDETEARGHRHVSSSHITDRAILRLQKMTDQPIFMFLHYFDPHYDFIMHPEFNFAPDYNGKVRKAHDIDELLRLAENNLLNSKDLDYLAALYDSEIAYTDDQIGRFLAELRKLGLYDDSLIVVTADHGESFAERPNRFIGHHRCMYQECLHVPLLVKLPGQSEPRVVEEWVSTIDIAPTILRAAQIPCPSMAVERRALTTELGGRAAFSQARFEADKDSVVFDGWKLIRHNHSKRDELYDLESDSRERRNLVRDEPERWAHLDALLGAWVKRMEASDGTGQEPEYQPEELDKLRSLGYVR